MSLFNTRVVCVLLSIATSNGEKIEVYSNDNLLCSENVWGLIDPGDDWSWEGDCVLELTEDPPGTADVAVAWLGNDNGTIYDETYEFDFFTFSATFSFAGSDDGGSVGLLFRAMSTGDQNEEGYSYLFSLHNNRAVLGRYYDDWQNIRTDSSISVNNNDAYTLKVSNNGTGNEYTYNFYLDDSPIFSNIELTDYLSGSFGVRARRPTVIYDVDLTEYIVSGENFLCYESLWSLIGSVNWTFSISDDSCILELPRDPPGSEDIAVAWLGNENGNIYDETYAFDYFTFSATFSFAGSDDGGSVGLLFRTMSTGDQNEEGYSYLFSLHNNRVVLGRYYDDWQNIRTDSSISVNNNDAYTLKVSNNGTGNKSIYNFYLDDSPVFSNIELTDYLDGSFGIRTRRPTVVYDATIIYHDYDDDDDEDSDGMFSMLYNQTIIAPWVFVIDDTGSMGGEIASVKSFVTRLITDIEAGGETPEYFVLAQFDDPVHFGNIYSTSSDFLSALDSIVAYGGGDCPEWGFSGIEAALTLIPSSLYDTDTVEVFFFTDAGQNSNDNITFTDVETLLTSKNARLHSIISYSGCNYLDTNWFNLADTSGGLYWVTLYSSDFDNSIEILKDFLSSRFTTLTKITTSDSSLIKTFEIDSGINCFSILSSSNIGSTSFLLNDPSGASYSLSGNSNNSNNSNIIITSRLYHAEICIGDDESLYGDWTVTVSYPSGGINTLTIYTTDVDISFDFSIYKIDSSDSSLDLVASNKLLYISGESFRVVVKLSSDADVFLINSINTISLNSIDGSNTISTSAVYDSLNGEYYGDFTFDSIIDYLDQFRVSVAGTDVGNYAFSRVLEVIVERNDFSMDLSCNDDDNLLGSYENVACRILVEASSSSGITSITLSSNIDETLLTSDGFVLLSVESASISIDPLTYKGNTTLSLITNNVIAQDGTSFTLTVSGTSRSTGSFNFDFEIFTLIGVIPTDSPTPAPSEYPTPAPTSNPTPSPTDYPTPSPTFNPTPSPTFNPTPSPTEYPTPSPTDEPTPSPTYNPSFSPTASPVYVSKCINSPCDCVYEDINCMFCQSNNICGQCKNGYFRLNDNTPCTHCQNTFGNECMFCQNGINGGCGQCVDGYTRKYDSQEMLYYCEKNAFNNPTQKPTDNLGGGGRSDGDSGSKVCPYPSDIIDHCSEDDRCVRCQSWGGCTECTNGYWLFEFNYKCQSCDNIDNCVSCNPWNGCSVCKPGFHIVWKEKCDDAVGGQRTIATCQAN